MKLVIRQYLASLKERDELDALLPDLLSQMGFDVFLKPGIGGRQYGVDIAAFGKLDSDNTKKVYLFSVKAGDLDRRTWDGGNPQDLRPSINEILDSFILTRIPPKYKSKSIEICLCFGGEIKEEVRANVNLFTQKNTSKKITFSEWNGDYLAELIETHFLKEELLPIDCRSQLRKAIAMLEEPDISLKYFTQLIYKLTEVKGQQDKVILKELRQLYLCLWVLYSWSRDQDNIESAYLASELALLNSWNQCKPFFKKKTKVAQEIRKVLDSIITLKLQICNSFLEAKILPYTNKMYALSNAVMPLNPVDTNLKLFDILGRLALEGCWMQWLLYRNNYDQQSKEYQHLNAIVSRYQDAIIELIENNPMLFTPYKDEQIIDISLAIYFLQPNHHFSSNIEFWITTMMKNIYRMLRRHDKYPSTIDDYAELIRHPKMQTEEYRKEITKGSVLYPYISVLSALMGFNFSYEIIQKIKSEVLPHCNYQLYFLDNNSEEHFYTNDENHGATFSQIPIKMSPEKFLVEIKKECIASNKISEMSAVKYGLYPIILMGCRHHRLPVPLHFFIEIDGEEEIIE